MRIAIISTGLGIVRRGFEVSAEQWAHALRKSNKAEVLLLSGGYHPDSISVPCISQTGRIAGTMRRLHLIRDGARLQQRSFTRGAKRELLRFKPDFVWLQEITLAQDLQRWIYKKDLPTKLVFCNGAPIGADLRREFDLVIDLIPAARDELLRAGFPELRSAVIPHPTKLDDPTQSRDSWRAGLDYSNEDFVILSVAAWNTHHKRIDYLIREIATARKTQPEIKLLLCGQPTSETAKLKQLGRQLLGDSVKWLTLPFSELRNAYEAADLFVLASNNEAFGAVITEAAIAGMPILCNDFPAARYILGDDHPGILNMTHPKALSNMLCSKSFISALPNVSDNTRSRFDPDYLADELLSFLNNPDK